MTAISFKINPILSTTFNVVQKTTKASITMIHLLRHYGYVSSNIPGPVSKVDILYQGFTKINQFCGLLELPKMLYSLRGAVLDEVDLHRKKMKRTQNFWKDNQEYTILMRSVSVPKEYSIFTSGIYLLARLAECVRPAYNTLAFLKNSISKLSQGESFVAKLNGPSVIFTNSYIFTRMLFSDKVYEPERELTDLFANMARIVAGAFITLNSITNKRQHLADIAIITCLVLDAISYLYFKNCIPQKRMRDYCDMHASSF